MPALSRPVLDAEVGYLVTPMEQGIRLTTGAEFAARDAEPTPAQFDRIMPRGARAVSVRRTADGKTWLGSRPCLPDSRPVNRAHPDKPGCGSRSVTHTGALRLAPRRGRYMIAEMMAGEPPFCDPAPYRAERFN